MGNGPSRYPHDTVYPQTHPSRSHHFFSTRRKRARDPPWLPDEAGYQTEYPPIRPPLSYAQAPYYNGTS